MAPMRRSARVAMMFLVMTFLALVALVSMTGDLQAQEIADCGILEQGSNCVLFFAQQGGFYELENLGGFVPGDQVFVFGILDAGCATPCVEADACIVQNTIEPANCGPPVLFIRGDANNDGVFHGLLDGLFILTWAFASGPAPLCEDAADSDDDGVLNPILDAVYLLNFLFIFPSPQPPPPFPDCGNDPTDDLLGCDVPTCP